MGFKSPHDVDSMKRSLRDKLGELRRNAGYKTQDSFAQALDVSLETVRNWEQGKTLPEYNALLQICLLLDCSIDYLFGIIPEQNYSIRQVVAVTGLSEKAVENLVHFQDLGNGGLIDVLSLILAHPRTSEYLVKLEGGIIEHKSNNNFVSNVVRNNTTINIPKYQYEYTKDATMYSLSIIGGNIIGSLFENDNNKKRGNKNGKHKTM